MHSPSFLKLKDNSKSPTLPTGSMRPIALVFYLLFHLAVCGCYFFWPILNPGTFQLIALAGLILATSIWAAVDINLYQMRPGSYPPFNLTGLVLITCLICWFLAFPLYLTSRKWLRSRSIPKIIKNEMTSYHEATANVGPFAEEKEAGHSPATRLIN